jgi:methyl-accepting chemotaxis protein
MFRSLTSALNNTRISVKLFIAPAIITVFMLGMGAISYYGSARQSAALDEIANVARTKYETGVAVYESISVAHISLFRMLSWAANSGEASKATDNTRRVEASQRAAATTLEQLLTQFSLSDDERKAGEVVRDVLKKYAEATKNVLEMATVDTATALLFMNDAEELYTQLEKSIESLATVQKNQSAETARAAEASATETTQLSIALLTGAVVLAIVVTLLVSRMIAKPILTMTGVMGQLAGGDHSVEVPATDRRDEVGAIAKAVLVFKDNMIKAKEAADREAEAQKARDVRAKEIDRLTHDFDTDVSQVLQTVASATQQMQSTASSMTKTAESTSRQSTAVAAAAEQASTNVQTVASAAEELSSSITEISRQVAQSAQIAGQAVEEASRTNQAVQGLAGAAQKIGDVVKLINDIAGQTNLLALNATIEAARAGEAGKGFAVVASEVKSLATQTAKATEEIGAQIGAIQSATQESVQAIEGIGKTIAEINQIATTIASAVEEQGAATQEIARNVQQAAAGTTEVTTNISGVNEAARDAGTAAGQVLHSTSELTKQSETLRGQVEKFLAAVKAA